MSTAKNQKAWRDRKKNNIVTKLCPCGKKLRDDSREICSRCWLKTSEGKAYNQHQVFISISSHVSKSTTAKKISTKFSKELGFVNLAALQESESKGCLELVGDNYDTGFVHFHHRKDKQTTIYSLAVLPEFQRCGWGRLLFYRVLCSAIEQGQNKILLKCPQDLPSNNFYKRLGFSLSQVEEGKKRKLNVWEYKINTPMLFYCADGGTNNYGEIARKEGWRLGFQSTNSIPKNHVEMIDNNWKCFDYQQHLGAIKKHKPLIATALDIENINDLPMILKQAREIAKYCGRVLLIPKVKCWLPNEFWLGYSEPSSHGATNLEIDFFKNRFVHVLGGSPTDQLRLTKQINAVVSLDGNYSMLISQYGKVCWPDNEIKLDKISLSYGCYSAFQESMKRQKAFWHGNDGTINMFIDLPLFNLVDIFN